jgi:type I restriction enzyme, S subunit
MAGEWTPTTLGDVLELKRGYDLPAAQRRPGKVPIVSSGGISGTHNTAVCRGPGVVTGRYGTIGQVFYSPDDFWPLNTTLYVRDFKGANPRFVAYFLKTLDFQAYTDKAAVPGINRNDLHRASVLWPPRAVQDRIAELLGSLDDKITLNRQMAGTLDEIARAQFESWFVDFRPVRSKAGGCETSLPEAIDSLFPSSLSDDGLPEGWKSEPLLAHARLISGGTPKTEEQAYWNGPILWASAKDVSQCPDRFLVATERTITELGLNESATRLVPRLSTVVVARGATTGRHCMVGAEMAMNQTCYALHSTVGAPFWLSCSFANIIAGLVQGAHGSVFDTITTTTIASARIVTGGEAIVSAFEELVAPLYNRILVLISESQSLTSLRDSLLSKLISGELRIKDAEKAVAA